MHCVDQDVIAVFKVSPRTRGPIWCLALMACLLLTGCGSTSVAVRTDTFPEPAVSRLPLHIGVHYTADFRQYQLQENIPQRGDYSIDIGEAQVEMLRALLPGMFQQVTELAEVEGDAHLPEDMDAVLVPSVDDMQFSIPAQTHSNFFEFWVRYQMRLQTPNGEEIGSWPVTAYGKTRDVMLESAEAALREAAVNALRDAGAFLAIGFPRQQEIQRWLSQRLSDQEQQSSKSTAGSGGES